MHISVIIPTLNKRPKYLQEAINSIEKQSYLPFEVIIVNNGREDLKISKTSLNIRLHTIVYKSGVAQARNFGGSLAEGDYLAFLDDDDLWGPDYLKNMQNKIEMEHPDCLVGRLDQFLNDKISKFKNADGQINKDIILRFNPGITGSSVVISRNVFKSIGGYNTKLPPSEDKSLILELLNRNFKVLSVPESQAIIRQSEVDRLTNNNSTLYEGIFQFYRLYKDQMNFSQRITNLYKINKYHWLSKKYFVSGLIYIFLFLLVKFMRFIK